MIPGDFFKVGRHLAGFMLDLAALVLGDFYTLMVNAFGTTGGWVAGHAFLVGLGFLGWTTASNWSDVKHGLDIQGMRIWAWLVFLGMTAGQIILYQSALGFPFVGALLTAIFVSWYVWWSWYTLEPAGA